MSGDVQPRKRKDKRRKKDEAPGTEEPVIQAAAVPTVNEDFNIHVHNDHGTGGGICAKLVFFVLLSVLAVLIGMIFIEKRGLTDLDIAQQESRFAQVFDGWIDESLNGHEEDDHHAALEDHDDHDEHEEHEASEEEHASIEEDDHDEHDEEHDEDHDEEHDEDHDEHEEEDEEDEEQQVSEEQEEDQEETEEQQISEEEIQASEERATEEDENEDEIEDQISQEIEEDNQEEEQEPSEEQTDEQEDEDEEEEETQTLIEDTIEEDEDNIENDIQASNEEEDAQEDQPDDDNDDDNTAEENYDDDNTAENEEDIAQEDDNNAQEDEDNNEDTAEEEETSPVEEQAGDEDLSRENEIFEEESAETAAGEDDNNEEEEVVDNTAGAEDALREEAEQQEEAEKEESSSMAVKLGVGVALLVVAHVVLVRKWRSGQTPETSTIEEVVDLSRRNTIVPPVPLEQIESEILDEDEYSEEPEDSEEEEEEEEEIIIEPVPVKKSYQELQSTYSRTLPPENLSKTTLEKKNVYYPRSREEEEDEEEDVEQVEDEEEVEEDEEVEETEEIDEGDAEGEDDEEDVSVSDVDDEELLKKLEAKYGKLPQRDNQVEDRSWKKIRVLPDEEGSDDDVWGRDTVPSNIRQNVKVAEANLRDNPDLAIKQFTNLLELSPNNNRIKYGRAQALDQLAELKRSNQLLQDAIASYYDLLQSNITDKLYLKVADRCIDRIRFRGHYNKAVQIHKELINRFPNDPWHRNQLAVTLLTSNRLAEAKPVLQEVLSRWPQDGFALAHYGFILKTKDNDMKTAVEYLRRGIESRVPGVIDGRFYFHLGDALQRLGRNDEAMMVYEDGVKHNVFLSKYQRSLYNVDRLTGKPWWHLHQTPYASFFKMLEEKWVLIREEGLALLSKAGYFKDEAENLRDKGNWKQFELFARGQKLENCKKSPRTCALIDAFPDAKGCRRGQVKFSVMHPGTHVWPHCGPSNCRLRAHLGLKVPDKTFIRVADETRSWQEGKIFLFDDSFEHEVWHNGTDVRLVLIVDVWHPELTAHEKRFLPAI